MRKFQLIILSLLIAVSSFAQSEDHVRNPYPDEVTIGAMKIERTGSEFTIQYKLLLGDDVRWCKTKLMISIDGGKTYSFTPSLENISGDFGKQETSGVKVIKYDVSADKLQLAGKPVVFKVDVTTTDVLKREILATAQAGVYPHLSYGFMFGMVKKYGWYVKAKSDFNFQSSSYNCTSTGEIEGGGHIWTDGASKKSRLVITAGGMFRASRWCYPYVGVGYGSRGLYWKDFQGEWAKVTDKSCAGVALDAGVALKFGKIALTLGVNNTVFKYTEAEVGIGVMF